MIRIGVPDLISPSYFPIVAAVDLGFFADRGHEANIDLVFPVDRAMEQLRDGALDLVGGTAHSATHAFPGWKGGRLLAALSQKTYWFLVVRSDLPTSPGDLSILSGLRIGAAPMVELSLRKIVADAGITDVQIQPVPREFLGSDMNFGLAAAAALDAGLIDGFWANGMGAEVAVQSGAGKVLLDARRGDGPPGTAGHTFAALVARAVAVDEDLDLARTAVAALTDAQHALREDPELAVVVAEKRFPPAATALIARLIERDAPFYDAAISPDAVASLQEFQIASGLLDASVPYDSVVETEVSDLWTPEGSRA